MTSSRQKTTDPERDVTRHTRQALTALADERDCLTAERAAFSRFHNQIVDMEAHASTPPPQKEAAAGSVIGEAPVSATPSSQLTNVRTAYCETVMSVPHYEDDYGQPLDEHLAEEFSPELARTLATADTLTPPLRDAFLAGCHKAIDSRQALLGALEQEADSLHHARDTLEEIETDLDGMNQRPIAAWSIDELIAGYERLQWFETRCDELAADRQAQLQGQRVRGPNHAGEDFNEYLYESLSVTHPVLADTATCSSLLRTAQQRLERALIDR